MGSVRDAEYAFYASEVGDLGSIQDVKAAFFAKFPSGISNSPRVGDSTNLRTFRAALAGQASAPCRIAFIGDSITEGTGASARSKRWQNLVRDSLRSKYGIAGGGEGFISAGYATSSWPQAFTIGAPGSVSGGFGPGSRNAAIGSGGTLTLNFTGTGLDVLYARGTAAGNFTWAIDGGAATQIAANNATVLDDGAIQIRGLSAGAHTLVLTGVSGTLYCSGAVVYNGDENSGLHLFDSAHHGFNSNQFSTASYRFDWHVNYELHLVVINLGTNDILNGSIPPAKTKSNIQNIIAAIRSKNKNFINPSFVITLGYERGYDPALASAPWNDYRKAMLQLAREDGKVAVFDASFIGSFRTEGNPYNLSADNLHLTDKGHVMYAERLVQFLTQY